jgi:hypothetical protein
MFTAEAMIETFQSRGKACSIYGTKGIAVV